MLVKKILLSIVFTAFSYPLFSQQDVKNIIFMIGDGMGLNQLYVAMTHNGNKLNIEECTYIGLAKTYSADSYITDSAAGGTALACGVKTRNGMIGQGADSSNVKSILEIAADNGLATGVVVTSPVTHATPAAFVAHQPNRNMHEAIAADFLKIPIDVFIGGGYSYFVNRKTDNRNLVEELKANGYYICQNLEQLSAVKEGKVAGLLYESDPPKAPQRNDMLTVGTQKALELLSANEKGFFLMIEGSQIDWGGHQNDKDYLLEEMMDFDKTIGIVLDFARENENTLVVITADHETGGMIITDGNFATEDATLTFTTTGHTGTMVPVYSYGVGAENFSGIFENTVFKEKFLKLYGFQE